MKKQMKDKCGGVCNSLIGLFLFVIFLIFVGNKEIRDLTNSNGGLAAWVQAFGSIAAIFGSAWVAKNYFLKSEVGREKKAARQLILLYKEIRLFYVNWADVQKKLLEDGALNPGSLRSYTAIANEYLAILKDIKLDELSLPWSSVGMRSRASIVYLVEELRSMEALQIDYSKKIKYASAEKSKLLKIERKKNALAISNTIIGIKDAFENLQNYLIENSREKCVYFSPFELSSDEWFEDFTFIAKAVN